MKKYQFKVDGYPPKKHGEKSMWSWDTESERLIALRKAALAGMGHDKLESNISLSIRLHIKGKNTRYTGDLDNYITGICDGLMMAANSGVLNECWDSPEHQDIHPLQCSFIADDSEIIKIKAEKTFDNPESVWYEILLEGEL